MYRCADILVPEKFEPKWCIEHCPGGIWQIIKACIGTFRRSLLPWRFWSRLRMSDRMKPKRIVAYLVVLLLLLVLAPRVFSPLIHQWRAAVGVWNDIHLESVADTASKQFILNQTKAVQGLSARTHARSLSDLPEDERERILAQTQRDFEDSIAAIEYQIDNPPQVDHSLALAILEAIVLPRAEKSFGVIRHADGTTTPYPPPNSIWGNGSTRSSVWSAVPEMYEYGPRTTVGLLIGALIWATFPLTFVLLPVSMRQAKVRWSHIWRATAYSIVVPIIAVALAWLTVALIEMGGPAVALLHRCVAVGFVPAALVVWWTSAVGRYLKMPHGFGVAILHMSIASGVVLAMLWMCFAWILFPY